MKKHIITAIVFVLLTILCQAQDTLVIYTQKDATISSRSLMTDVNDGNSTTFNAKLYSGKTAYMERSLIEFDLSAIPEGATITQANLQLYGLAHAGGNNSIISPLTEAWDENTVTWDNAPAFNNFSIINIPQSTNPTENYSINITGYCTAWHDNTMANNGLIIRTGVVQLLGNNELSFASFDYADSNLWPRLEIIYEASTDTGTNCVTAINETITDSLVEKMYVANGADELWLKVIPEKKYFAIKISELETPSGNSIEGIDIYSGSCNDLTLIKTIDTTELYIDSLLAGHVYFIKVKLSNSNSVLLNYHLLYDKGVWIGEHNVFPSDLHWFDDIFAGRAKTYEIECVSFPFIPDCINMTDFYNNGCADESLERNLELPDHSDYGNVHSYDNAFFGEGWSKILRKCNRTSFAYNNAGHITSGLAVLATNRYMSGNNINTNAERKVYPHSILKYSIYLHEDIGTNSAIIDTMVFLVDYTKGDMKRYPFWDKNEYRSISVRYDVEVHPHLLINPNGQHYYNSTTNGAWYGGLGTINYFPLLSNIFNVTDFAPSNLTENFYYAYPPPDHIYMQPPPYSLLTADCFCALMDQGITHNYTVDKYIDLSLINPDEKIFYNPSEVSIEHDLTFPSGYSFLTLPESDIFPERGDLESNYPLATYKDIGINIHHVHTIPYQYNNIESYYYIKNGATLTIEPCVTIIDATFIVESGGTLIYDPDKTYGNFEIDLSSTGNILTTTYTYPTYCDEECIQPFMYNAHDITIDTDITWTKVYLDANYGTTNGDMGISGNIVILDGSRLIVEDGVTLRFGTESTITVNPGGELVLSGSSSEPVTLTNACLNSWLGIIVNGDEANQKYGAVKSLYSHIENAETGIESFEGGKIFSTFSTYKNNEFGVKFNSFTGTHSSRFTRCSFDYDMNTANSGFTPRIHVLLNDVGTIKFVGCNLTGSDNTGRGIQSVNSDFSVIPYYIVIGGSSIKGKFEDLEYGIKASGYRSSSVTIKNTEFTDNFRGVLLENTDFATVLANNFKTINSIWNWPQFDVSYGLYLNSCTGYDIQNNHFNEGIVGLYINNSGMLSNDLYNNSFDNINIANYGLGFGLVCLNQNSDNTAISLPQGPTPLSFLGVGNIGLELKCNDFTQNAHSISVLNGSIQKTQGRQPLFSDDYDYPAGNTFDVLAGNCLNGDNAFYVNSNHAVVYDYYFHSIGDETDMDVCYTDNKINTLSTGVYYEKNNACPDLVSSSGFSISTGVAVVTEKSLEVNTLKNDLELLVDGGNTDYLLNQIENTSSGRYKKLCDELLQYSPYLSDDVLVKFMSGEKMYNPVRRSSVVLANSPLPTVARDEIDNMFIPQHFKDVIWQYQDGINQRVEKEQELISLIKEKQNVYDKVIRDHIKNDSVPEVRDSLICFLETQPDYQAKFALIPIYIEEDRLTDANSKLNELEQELLLLPSGVQEYYEYYVDLQRIMVEIAGSPDSVFIEKIELNRIFLEELAVMDNVKGNIAAQLLLEQAGIHDYEEQCLLPTTMGARSMEISIEEHHNITGDIENIITVYPNPANNKLVVEYAIFDESVENVIGLYDLKGNLLLSSVIDKQIGVAALDVSSIANGNYIMIIGDKEVNSYTKQISIVH